MRPFHAPNNNNNNSVVVSFEEDNNNSARTLFAAGIRPPELCVDLAARHTPERIADVIRRATSTAVAHPAGWRRAALDRGWTWPTPKPSPRTSPTEEERQQAARGEAERAQLRYQQIAHERQQAEEARLARLGARPQQRTV